MVFVFFFFQAEDGIRDLTVTGVQTCALPIFYIRWNALAMVLQANKKSSEYGGHLSSYASSATLYEVGFNHVWRAPSEQHPGDMGFIQGHSSPGIYAGSEERRVGKEGRSRGSPDH